MHFIALVIQKQALPSLHIICNNIGYFFLSLLSRGITNQNNAYFDYISSTIVTSYLLIPAQRCLNHLLCLRLITLKNTHARFVNWHKKATFAIKKT